MKSTFKHSPLPHGQYFRVLKLLPGTFEDPIQCELPTYELDNAPSYEPISYAWGDPTMSHEITVDNCTLFITKTLFQALRRFRQQAERRFLWTDGICINQSDDTEKGHQVGFMSNIYEHGSRTLIWLGENDEHEDCAMTEPGCAESSFAMIKEFNRCVQSRIMDMDRTGDENIFVSIRRIPPISPELVLWSEKRRHRCLKHLFNRPWFSRCWVLMEVALSRQATAFIGSSTIQWSEIALCAEVCASTLIGNSDAGMGMTSNAFKAIWAQAKRHESWINDKELWILRELATFQNRKDDKFKYLKILCSSRSFFVTIPQDHVFAFLGHPSLQGLIDADYTLSLSAVHLRLAEQILLKTQQLDLLCFVENTQDDLIPFASLPSWVPQWHRSLMLSSAFHENFIGLEVDQKEIIVDVSSNNLTVTTLLIDKVNRYSRQFTDKDRSFKTNFVGFNFYSVQNFYEMYQDALRSANIAINASN